MNKRLLMIVACVAILFSFRIAAPTTWNLDTAHSNLQFSILHLSLSEITGTVQMKKATITSPGEDFSGATVTMEADMNTIDTDNDKRDTHLKSADFFDTSKFPDLTFKSTSVKKVSENNYELTGDLSLHGVTKPVTLNALIKSGMNPTNNKPVTACKVTGKINRTDFGVATSAPEGVLSNEVSVVANMEFAKD